MQLQAEALLSLQARQVPRLRMLPGWIWEGWWIGWASSSATNQASSRTASSGAGSTVACSGGGMKSRSRSRRLLTGGRRRPGCGQAQRTRRWTLARSVRFVHVTRREPVVKAPEIHAMQQPTTAPEPLRKCEDYCEREVDDYLGVHGRSPARTEGSGA